MLKILAACGNGMGSSMIIKMKIEKIMKELNIECTIKHSSVGEAKNEARDYDIVLCAINFKNQFNVGKNTKVIGLINLLSEDEIRNKIKEALNI
ncbi:PTS sugar transporter subunit IIB [Oceanotoga teriensis]|jgi:PTS system ascorbate-specific IIB component|uniref:PTS sugar transporter subunit IIB n=1 Tax=Oceanotoga teriensis TaxID=515440 RepID=UPI002712D22F|nr:PTS sugar transporter subunit IIB [Oceanotoga teriensis]MDO7976452.1 PTS sugar transporter subunit IIB [Oceanotoga teriensis]